jgi:carbon storage regulator CsrA
MLVLTRKQGETIEIGQEAPITVTLVKSSAGQARIGIEAPVGLRISRAERDPGERLPIHPRDDDQWFSPTSVPGIELAVDATGCIVLHTDSGGSYTVTNVESLIEGLRQARGARNALEALAEEARTDG